MGGIGPRRVVLSDRGEALPPPAKITDNESTWLEKTDLVFIDPVSTGFSRPVRGEDRETVLRIQTGSGQRRGFYSNLDDALFPLVFTENPCRRELRNNPRGGAEPVSAGSIWNVCKRDRADQFGVKLSNP